MNETDTEQLLRRVWAFAHVFVMLTGLEWIELLQNGSYIAIVPTILMLLAVVNFYSPQTNTFRAMLFTQVLFAISTLPDLQNHRYLMMFANVGLLSLAHNERYFNEKTRWYVSRLLIVTYFYATFHKINYDFLNPETSCATQFLSHVKSNLTFLNIPGPFLTYGTIFLEGLLVLLLLSSRLWKIAALIAVFFHVGLSFDYTKLFINFTGVMVSLFIIATCTMSRDSLFINRTTMRCLPIILGIILSALVTNLILRDIYVLLIHAVFLFWIGGLTALILINNPPSAGQFSIAGALLVVLFFINGASPYLGIKNRGSLNMYSNLLVSKDYSNHVIMGKSLDIFGFNGKTPDLPLGKVFPFRTVDPNDRSACVW